jgi:hypothetical protein
MVHSCANYKIPYEPHLGIPLIPGFPAATASVFQGRVAAHRSTWDSLNFVTAAQVRQLARRFGQTVTFDEGELASSFERLLTDDTFAARQLKTVAAVRRVRRVLRLAQRTGALGLLRRWPAEWATPMTFTFKRARQPPSP